MRVTSGHVTPNEMDRFATVGARFLNDAMNFVDFDDKSCLDKVLSFQCGAFEGVVYALGLTEMELRDVMFINYLRSVMSPDASAFMFQRTMDTIETKEGVFFYREGSHAVRFAMGGDSAMTKRLANLLYKPRASTIHIEPVRILIDVADFISGSCETLNKDLIEGNLSRIFLYIWGVIDFIRQMNNLNLKESMPMLLLYLQVYELMPPAEAKKFSEALHELLQQSHHASFFKEGVAAASDFFIKKQNVSQRLSALLI